LVIVVVVAYAVAAVFVAGIATRVYVWAATPVPIKIPTTPAPRTYRGVVFRMAGEVLVFTSLFRADKLLWVGAWAFHAGLVLVIIRHLRYFVYPVPDWILYMQTPGVWAGYLLLLPILLLLARRLLIRKVIYVTILTDFFALALLGGIAGTGILMRYVARAYLVDVKAFILGLLTLDPVSPPTSPFFLAHILLVCLLLAYFPFSKLMHAPGLFFSPTRNARNNQRTRPQRNPWDSKVPWIS
jgi:nitrate reductase gamma subunit